MTIADGKDIVLFAFCGFDEVAGEQFSLGNMLAFLEFFVICGTHLPFLAISKLFISKWFCNSSFYSYSGWYYTVVTAQAIGGVFTVVPSIYFAALFGEPSAIISSVIGVYTLAVATATAVLKGQEQKFAVSNEGTPASNTTVESPAVNSLEPAIFTSSVAIPTV